MERITWKSYKEVNRHPNKTKRLDTVGSVLHSICCVDDIFVERGISQTYPQLG